MTILMMYILVSITLVYTLLSTITETFYIIRITLYISISMISPKVKISSQEIVHRG